MESELPGIFKGKLVTNNLVLDSDHSDGYSSSKWCDSCRNE